MTGIKIALGAIGAVGGISSTITGAIVANTPSIAPDTPINLTLALVGGGVAATAIAAWKVSRAWSQMESKVAILEAEVASLKKSRSAALLEKLHSHPHHNA